MSTWYETLYIYVESSFTRNEQTAFMSEWKLRVWHLVESNANNVFLTCLLSDGNDVIFKYIHKRCREPAIPFFILYDYSHSCWNGIHLQIPFFYSSGFFLNEIFFNKEGSRKQFNILIHIYLFGVRFSFWCHKCMWKKRNKKMFLIVFLSLYLMLLFPFFLWKSLNIQSLNWKEKGKTLEVGFMNIKITLHLTLIE